MAELQVRLSQLGFDPGRVDGIFGSRLDQALVEFQRNCGLEPNGTLTQCTLVELRRFSSRAERTLVGEARDEAGFEPSRRGPLIVWGPSPLTETVARQLPNSDFDESRTGWTVERIASYANEVGARGVISLSQDSNGDALHLHYWSSYQSYSRSGEQLASAIAGAVSHDDITRVEVTGMALPILRETQMTTLHVEHRPLAPDVLGQLAMIVSRAVNEFFHSSTA